MWTIALIATLLLAGCTAAPAGLEPQDGSCFAEPMQISWDFERHVSPDFSFVHPADWRDVAGVTLPPAAVLDPETFAETGLSEDATSVPLAMLQDPASMRSVLVLTVEGVGSSTAEVIARIRAQRQESKPLNSQLCLGGEPALGVEGTGTETRTNVNTGEVISTTEFYTQTWFLVRDGMLYYLQWIDDDPGGVWMLKEIASSWEWGWADGITDVDPGPEDASATGTILSAGMALEPPASGSPVDPSTFRSTFPADAPRIYLVYELRPGTVTEVTFDWYQNGEFIFSDTFNWTATTTWGWSAIRPPSGGFEPGVYEAEIRLDTGESRTSSFTVEEP